MVWQLIPAEMHLSLATSMELAISMTRRVNHLEALLLQVVQTFTLLNSNMMLVIGIGWPRLAQAAPARAEMTSFWTIGVMHISLDT